MESLYIEARLQTQVLLQLSTPSLGGQSCSIPQTFCLLSTSKEASTPISLIIKKVVGKTPVACSLLF